MTALMGTPEKSSDQIESSPESTNILLIRPKKRKLFVSCNGPEKNRVGRLAKSFFLRYFFGQICVFYACFTLLGRWEGEKNFRVGISLNKKC